MNVTQLQQPPLQSVPPRSASEAKDITPDVCCLPVARNCSTHTPLAVLVGKTTVVPSVKGGGNNVKIGLFGKARVDYSVHHNATH